MTLLVILIVGALLHFEALTSSYILDDYLHASMLRGSYPAARTPLDLYDFVNDADRQVLTARGTLPWWSDPHLKIRFFRPLSSGLIWTEHRVLGDAPLPLHLHSLAWWIALVLVAHALFRRLMPERPALIATAIFALAPCHAIPLAWLANREVLITLTFGLLGLIFLDRARVSRGVLNVAAASLLFGVSLLAGEYALGIGAYVVAASLASSGLTPAKRLAGIASFGAPASVYLFLRARLECGTLGSGFYTDPSREPWAYVTQIPRRAATLLLDAWLSLDHQTLTGSTPTWLVLTLVPVVAIPLGIVVRRAYGKLDPASRSHTRVLLVGSLLSMFPVLAVVPSPRLVGAAMVGISAVVALVLDAEWLARAPARGSGNFGGLVALLLGFAHLVHGPATALLVGREFHQSSKAFAASAANIAQQIGDPGDRQVFVLRGGGASFFLPFGLTPTFAPPKEWIFIANTGHILARRRDARTLDIFTPSDQPVYALGTSNLFRRSESPLHVGEVFAFEGVKVTILQMGPNGPQGLRVEAERDLDSYPWITETKDGFELAELPGIGFGQPFDP